jgi:hypothetical protein
MTTDVVLQSTIDTTSVVLEENTGVLVQTEDSAVVTLVDSSSIISSNDTVEYVLSGPSGPPGPQGPQGPQGPAGVVEEEMTYSKRIDFVTDSILYRGEAQVGSLENSSVWRIRKIVISPDGDVSETWADGVATFNKIWANRAAYSYS